MYVALRVCRNTTMQGIYHRNINNTLTNMQTINNHNVKYIVHLKTRIIHIYVNVCMCNVAHSTNVRDRCPCANVLILLAACVLKHNEWHQKVKIDGPSPS